MQFNFLKSFLLGLFVLVSASTFASANVKFDSGINDEAIVKPMMDDSSNQPIDTAAGGGAQANGLLKDQPKSLRVNGVFERKIYQEKQVIPYDHIRESDVFWSKRIWRVIDVREKMNLPFKFPFHFPDETFFSMIHRAVLGGEVQAFEDDDFRELKKIDVIKNLGAGVDTVPQTDPITGEVTGYVPKVRELDYSKVYQFRLKEDWFFDEETSTMQVRILGIAPILEINPSVIIPMYWVYYPDMRKVFARKEIFNPKNDAIRMTWEDIMEFRYFSSYIIKESNVYDRKIADYANGIDALLEGERVKTDIFNFEHDLWSY